VQLALGHPLVERALRAEGLAVRSLPPVAALAGRSGPDQRPTGGSAAGAGRRLQALIAEETIYPLYNFCGWSIPDVAFLAADVVGYWAMVAKDEPAALARVRTLRTDLIEPLATDYGGRLLKTTGDGFLTTFASSVQPLRCAIAIQERLNSEPDGLQLRIGVHQGEVVAEGRDRLTDGVIIAARLEPFAEPGGILFRPCP